MNKKDNSAKPSTWGKILQSHQITEMGKFQIRFLQWFSIFLHWFEVGLAALTMVFVVLALGYFIEEIFHFQDMVINSNMHIVLEEILADILLLVVGIELAIMLIRRTPESLVEVMFFVIARKMLIKTDHIYELLLGVIAIAGLFAIRKYLQRR